MISSFKVKGYRKFADFRLDNLNRINFFVGKNNVGKTSLLEAIYGWASGKNLSPFFWTGSQRNQNPQNFTAYHIAENIVSSVYTRNIVPFEFELSAITDDNEITYRHTIALGDIFKDFIRDVAMNSSISNVNSIFLQNQNQQFTGNMFAGNNITIAQWEIESSDSTKKSFLLNWPNLFMDNVTPQLLASYKDINTHRNMDENRNLYTYLKRNNLLNTLIKEMKLVFPKIKSFDILPYNGNSLAPVNVQLINDEFFPIDTFGDGLRRFFQIIGSLVFYHDSMICIDEIDATIHPEAQKELGRNLIVYARKYNVQLFVTTHNLEFIDAFLSAWQEDETLRQRDDIRIITLKDTENGLKARTMTGEKALNARESFNLELR